MPLSPSRLNTARYTSVLADVQVQFPINAGLLPAEQSQCNTFQQKFAHAVADHEGTDVVTEIDSNAIVPAGIAVQVSLSTGIGQTTANGVVE